MQRFVLSAFAILAFTRVLAQDQVETCLGGNESDFKVTSAKSCPCYLSADVRANASTTNISITVVAIPTAIYNKWRDTNFRQNPHDVLPLPKDPKIIRIAQLPFSSFKNRSWKLRTTYINQVADYKLVTIFRRRTNGTSNTQCVKSAISLEPRPKICPLRIPVGYTTYATHSILGGAPVTEESDFAGYNVLIHTGARKKKCGGSIIAKDWVLTAASCNITRADNVSVVGRMTRGETYGIKRVIAHERFADLSKIWDGGIGYQNDIALLNLNAPIEGSKILRLNANGTAPVPGTLVRTIAFEYTGSTASVLADTKGLRMVDVAIDREEGCRERFISQGSKNMADSLDERMICTKHDAVCTFGSICDSDVGSPLVALLPYGNESRGETLQIGLVTRSNSECINSETPDLFTRTSAFVPWIEKTAGIAVKGQLRRTKGPKPKTVMIIVVVAAGFLFVSSFGLLTVTVIRRKRRKENEDMQAKAEEEVRLRELMASWEQFNQERAMRESTVSAMPQRDYDYRLSFASGPKLSVDERRLTF